MKVNFRRTWQISLIMAVLMLVIGIAIAPRDVDLYAQHVESLMAKGDYQEALKVGERSDKTNRKLLQLRMEALNHEHLLGERLFQYPITGKGDEFIKKGGDYELCGYLINKDLDRFVEVLPRHYKIDKQLPRYYKQALIQYNHLRSTRPVNYQDEVMETDYQDMQRLAAQYPDKKARQVAVFRQYEGTYWYFYAYLH